jgi:hypothetical protein
MTHAERMEMSVCHGNELLAPEWFFSFSSFDEHLDEFLTVQVLGSFSYTTKIIQTAELLM